MKNSDATNQIQEAIIQQIEELTKEKSHILIAIDGRCASGKTTLAAQLQEKLHCSVIHMDEFFLRPEQRTEERLQMPGGNVDYERFLEEVLRPLHAHQPFSYRPYDCHTQTLKEPIAVNSNRVTVIEGSYSCHPALWEHYDLHIFLDIDEKEQMRRILLRNGSPKAAIFAKRWIPLEETYFANFHIKQSCEITMELKDNIN